MENEKLEPEKIEETTPNFDIDSSGKEVVELYLDDIIPNRFQPRERFDENALKELAASIKEHGVIQPIIVRKIGDKYEIIAGERRYKASAIAGLTKIPAIIRNLDDKESSKVALLENLQRKNLSAIEEARTYQKILDLDQMTQFELAKTMGKSQPAVANKLRLLSLPDEVQDALLKEKISERHARSLLNVENEQEQIDLLHKIINNRMTVRELDAEIKQKENPLQGLLNEKDMSITPEAEKPVEEPFSPHKARPTEGTQSLDENNNFNSVETPDLDELRSKSTNILPDEAPLADLDQLLKMTGQTEENRPKSDYKFVPEEEPELIETQPEDKTESLEDIQPSIPAQAPSFVPEEEPEMLDDNAVSSDILNNNAVSSDILNNNIEQLNIEDAPITRDTTIDNIDSVVQKAKDSGMDISIEKMNFGETYQIIIRINGR